MVPVAGMALILGIDRFMSECRALTNFIGNAVATVVVARWEGALDREACGRRWAQNGMPVVRPWLMRKRKSRANPRDPLRPWQTAYQYIHLGGEP